MAHIDCVGRGQMHKFALYCLLILFRYFQVMFNHDAECHLFNYFRLLLFRVLVDYDLAIKKQFILIYMTVQIYMRMVEMGY